ncbi:MAG: DUF4880 domain-containing protein [Pseudomonas sp.]|jgi:transmembrane sensor|nr:DUF4880 domain-containing protein [Pseudomonas sp.]
MKSPSPAQSHDTVITEAASWCLRMHDEACSAEDHAAFERWLQADPLHTFEYAKMLEIWDLSEKLADCPTRAKKLLTLSAAHEEGTLDM